MPDHVELRRGAYYDSVSLMQVSRTVAVRARRRGRPGRHGDRPQPRRHRAAWASTSPTAPSQRPRRRHPRQTRPASRPARLPLEAALADLQSAGTRLAAGSARRLQPAPWAGRSSRSGANLALVSVPGQHAVAEAFDAIRPGVSRDALLRQRPRRGRGPAQGRRGRRRRARHGPRLRHGGRRGRGARLRQRRAARLGRHRRGLGHRGPAGDVPARRGRGRHEPLPRCRRPRPVEPASRAAPRGRRSRRSPPTRPPSPSSSSPSPRPPRCSPTSRRMPPGWACRSTGRRSGAGRPDLTAAVEAVLRADGPHGAGAGRSWTTATRSRRRLGARCAGSSAAAPSPTRRCSSPSATLGGIRSNIPLAARPRPRRRPARRRPRRHRLRRRRADPRPRPPDDRPVAAARADRRRGHRPDVRRAAARPRPRPRRPPGPGRRARRGRPRGPRHGAARRPGACPSWSRSPAPRTTRRAWTAAPTALQRAGASVLLSNAEATRHALDLP